MTKRLMFALLLPSLAAMSSLALAADAPWEAAALTAPPDAILQAVKASPAPEDADMEMLFEEHCYRFDAQGRQHRTIRRVFRYLTEQGVEDWSCVEGDWSPGYEERPKIRARVISPDGKTRGLDPDTIGEVPVESEDPNLLSDQKLLRAPLPAIEVGAVVEQEVVGRQSRPLFDEGTVERVLLAQSYPSRKFRLVIDVPAAMPLRYEVLSSQMKPSQTATPGRRQLIFETGPAKAHKIQELFVPPQQGLWPQVVFSTGKSWTDVAAGYAAVAEPQIDLEAVRPMVRQAIGDEKDRTKIATRLLAVLRGQLRYTGIEFGKQAIIPRPTRETLARRYGDCKDQSVVLVAMLRAAGLPAQVALLRSGRSSDVEPSLPGLGDFDHAIVCLPGQSPLWIDPTARCCPVGQLPLDDQGRWALIVHPQTRELVRTPKMDHTANTSTEAFEITLADSGKARVRVTLTGSGPSEEAMRDDYALRSNKDLRRLWRDYFRSAYRAQSLKGFEYTSPMDLTKPLRVTAETADAQVGDFEDNDAVVVLQPDGIFDRLPSLLKSPGDEEKDDQDETDEDPSPLSGSKPRRMPLLLPEPHVRQVQYRLVLPVGFQLGHLPEGTTKRIGPLTVSQQFERTEDNAIVATFRLDTGPGLLSAAEVNALREWMRDLNHSGEDGHWEVKINLEHMAGKLLAAGQVKEALAECRRLIEAYPGEVAPRIRYARMLLKLGLGDAARAEARRAVERHPKSAAAHAALGRILTHDLLGRHFHSGMDWSAAATAYVRALELDPTDVTTRMDWAILLEHNADGRRYASDARLDEAIAEYRKAQKQLGTADRLESLDSNLGFCLLYNEKFADLERLAQRVKKNETWNALLVAAVAAQAGVDEARQRVAQLVRAADRRSAVLETAGEYLHEARCYARAAALLEAAAKQSVDAELKRRARLIGRQRQFNEADLGPDGPRHVVQELLLAAICEGKRKARLPELFARGTAPEDREAVVEELAVAWRSFLESERRTNRPPQRTADILWEISLKAEGDDAGGYRVTTTEESLKKCAWYVVKEDAGYRLLPPGRDQENLGRAALERLDRNDLAGAASVLRWAAARSSLPSGWMFAPLQGTPFIRLWLQADPQQIESVRLAAAALAAGAPDPRPAIAILESARKNKPNVQIDRALVEAYINADRFAEAIEAADRILKDHETAYAVLSLKIKALHGAARRDDLRKLLQNQYELAPSRPELARILAAGATIEGDFDLAERCLRPLSEESLSVSEAMGRLAWLAVARDRVDSEAIERAQNVARRLPDDWEARYALAVVYAATGKCDAALEELKKCIAARGDLARDDDWYVLGRIAEHYGLNDIAADLYRKIARPKRLMSGSAYVLAQQRLKRAGNR